MHGGLFEAKNQRFKATRGRKDFEKGLSGDGNGQSGSDSDWSSPERGRAGLAGRKGGKKLRKKRGIPVAMPVAPPRLPFEGGGGHTSQAFMSQKLHNAAANLADAGNCFERMANTQLSPHSYITSGSLFFLALTLTVPHVIDHTARADNGDSLSASDLSNGEGLQADDDDLMSKRFLRQRPKFLHSRSVVDSTDSLQSPTNNSPFDFDSSHLSYSSSSCKSLCGCYANCFPLTQWLHKRRLVHSTRKHF